MMMGDSYLPMKRLLTHWRKTLMIISTVHVNSILWVLIKPGMERNGMEPIGARADFRTILLILRDLPLHFFITGCSTVHNDCLATSI